MSKDKTTKTETSGTSTIAPDATSAANAQTLWNLGLNATKGSAPSYDGQLTAGLSPDQQAAFGLIRGAGDAGKAQLATGTQYATQAGGFTPGAITPGTANVSTVGGVPQVGTTDIAGAPLVSAGMGVSAGPAAAARDVTAKNFTDYDISKYLSPYTQNVVDTSLSDIERSRKEAQNAISGRQAASGSFGDARSGVEASLTNRDYTRQSASTAAALRQAGYVDAANRIEQDANRTLSGDQGNQGADVATSSVNAQTGTQANIAGANLGLAASQSNASNSLTAQIERARNALTAGTTNATLGANVGEFNAAAQNAGSQFNVGTGLTAAIQNGNNGLASNAQKLGAATTLGNLGMSTQQQALGQANALGAAGAVEQGTQQAGLTAEYSDWLRKQGWSDQQIQQLTSIYGAMPKGSTTTTNQTDTTHTPSSLIPSLLGAGLGLIPGIGQIGTVLGGAISRSS